MKIERKFTTVDQGAYGALSFTTTTSEIRNPDGKVVFRNEAVEIPEGWSQVAADVIAQKYFRRAGVPAVTKRVAEKGVPRFLWRHFSRAKTPQDFSARENRMMTRKRTPAYWRMSRTMTLSAPIFAAEKRVCPC